MSSNLLTQFSIDRLTKVLSELFIPAHVSSNGGDTLYVYLSPDAANLLSHILTKKKTNE